MKPARLVAALVAMLVAPASAAFAQSAAGAPAADPGPVTHTDQLVVITPNAPVMVVNGTVAQPAGPGAVAPVAPVGATAGANGAPINEPWDGVSHINGTLVKVGERSDYLLRYRKTNISSNPLGWMVGFYGLSASYAVNANIAIRGDANIFSNDDFDGYELGLSAPIYLKRMYSGPFIEPGIITRSITDKNSYCDTAYSGGSSCMGDTSTMVGPEMLVGWHSTFDSGFNVAAAFGIARNLRSENNDIEPAGYFRVGYAY